MNYSERWRREASHKAEKLAEARNQNETLSVTFSTLFEGFLRWVDQSQGTSQFGTKEADVERSKMFTHI